MTQRCGTWVVALFISCTTAGLMAQQPPAAAQAGPATVSADDEKFVKDVARGIRAGVTLGQLAMERAKDPRAKALAQQIVDNDRRLDGELTRLAASRHIDLDESLDSDHEDTRDRLANATGSHFDRVYADAMLNDHEVAVAAFKREATESPDPEIRVWATKTLATVEAHLQMSQELQRIVGPAPSENRDR